MNKMIPNFEHTQTQDFEKLKKAIAYITVYVAGADGHIDEKETAWASKLTNIRSYAGPEILAGFYEEVGKDFDEVLAKLMASLPSDTEARNAAISEELASLNVILAGLANPIGAALYESYTSFAKHVAKSDGGFLGFGSISKEEADVIGLTMLDPIELIEEEEEE